MPQKRSLESSNPPAKRLRRHTSDRSAVESRHVADVSASLGNPSGTTKRLPTTVTYRLQGVPYECGRQGVESLIRRTLQLGSNFNVELRSLADSPYQQKEKVATVHFSSTPASLSQGNVLDEWHFDVPHEGQTDGATIRLVFDTHFRGLTPLHGDDEANGEVE
jgi:hypothetical protein